MTRLPFDAYLDHIRRESARFRDVLTSCDPAARVPSCPDWDAGDLLWHLTRVQAFWSDVVRRRPATPEGAQPPRSDQAYADLLSGFDAAHAALVAALESADPADAAWTWAQEQTVGFIYRRQAHEVLIHRLDAELACGVVSPLDPRLAADGVEEALAVIFGGIPPWGSFAPRPDLVRMDLSDTDTQVWVRLGHFSGTSPEGQEHVAEPGLAVVADPGVEPDVVVEGLAGDVDAWLWRRRDDADINVAGARAIHERFLAHIRPPNT